jgi:hypothetical protein
VAARYRSFDVIQSVLEPHEELSSVIYPLDQTDEGFVGDGKQRVATQGPWCLC